MKVFIIIPGLNEEKYLPSVLKSIKTYTKNIVYVDDGSKDHSVTIAKKHLSHVLAHSTNLGKGAALKTGCEYAFKKLKADAVVFMDADGQHNPVELPKFFAKLKKGSEIIFGVRKFSTTMPLIRLLGNRFASIVLNILFHRYIPDIPSGYKAMSRRCYQKLQCAAPGYEIETEIAAKVAKYNIPVDVIEIESIYHDPEKGMTALDALHIAYSLIRWRFFA